jgi:hypothetical protein
MKSQPSKTPKILKCKKAQKTRAPPQDKSSDEEKFADAEGWDDKSYSGLSVGHEDANAYGVDEGTAPVDTEQTLCTAFTIFGNNMDATKSSLQAEKAKLTSSGRGGDLYTPGLGDKLGMQPPLPDKPDLCLRSNETDMPTTAS